MTDHDDTNPISPLLAAALSELAASERGARLMPLTDAERADLPVGWQERLRGRMRNALQQLGARATPLETLLAEARHRAKISIESLAAETGIAKGDLEGLERGVQPDRVLRLAPRAIAVLTDRLGLVRTTVALSIATALRGRVVVHTATPDPAAPVRRRADRDEVLGSWLQEYLQP